MSGRRRHAAPWRILAPAGALLFGVSAFAAVSHAQPEPPAMVIAGPDVGLAAADLPAGADAVAAGRFTVIAWPHDARLARSVLEAAQARDTFPGLPRPAARVVITIAPDLGAFREMIGPAVPEWGAAVAFPDEQRIVLQGSRAGTEAGDPLVTLRHELAHLALHEAMGNRPPRWFDEGYASVAAGEWSREDALATSVALALRGVPDLETLETLFAGGAQDATAAYALAHGAVAELAALDPQRGLSLFFARWRETDSFERAVREAYGLTSAMYEERWRETTWRRYGALALLANASLAFGIFALVIGPFYWSRRRRDRERLAALRAADARQQAEADALRALLMAADRADGATPASSV